MLNAVTSFKARVSFGVLALFAMVGVMYAGSAYASSTTSNFPGSVKGEGNEIVESDIGMKDFIYTDPATGKIFRSILNKPSLDSDPAYAINVFGHITFYSLVGFGFLTFMLWLVNQRLSKRRSSKPIRTRALKIALLLSLTLTILAGAAFIVMAILFEVSIAGQSLAPGISSLK